MRAAAFLAAPLLALSVTVLAQTPSGAAGKVEVSAPIVLTISCVSGAIADDPRIQINLDRLEAFTRNQHALIDSGMQRLRTVRRVFASHRVSLDQVNRAHQALPPGVLAANQVDRIESPAGKLTEDLELLNQTLNTLRDEFAAMVMNARSLREIGSALSQAEPGGCTIAPPQVLTQRSREFQEQAERAIDGLRDITDAAFVGLAALPQAAGMVGEEAKRLRALQQSRTPISATQADTLGFRQRLGTLNERLARLEAGVADAPTRLAVDFPRTPVFVISTQRSGHATTN
ncbi:MAG: hypothetical protein ACKVQK_20515 [Burkholderiales bacterium]